MLNRRFIRRGEQKDFDYDLSQCKTLCSEMATCVGFVFLTGNTSMKCKPTLNGDKNSSRDSRVSVQYVDSFMKVQLGVYRANEKIPCYEDQECNVGHCCNRPSGGFGRRRRSTCSNCRYGSRHDEGDCV